MSQEDEDTPEHHHVNVRESQRFRDKMRVYRKATVALVLFAKMLNDARYAPVIDAFNRCILPREPSAIALYAAQIRNAGQDLDELLNRPGLGHHLEWSEMWLREIKHIETNPVTLIRFAHFWMKLYTAIHQGLDEHFPPTPER